MSDDFEADDVAPGQDSENVMFQLDVEGYEGPIEMLLQLARDQKVDLVNISILALAEQYLEFIRQARALRLELAADYLVMAAWLAYLKSRLLLPAPKTEEEEPSGAEMAAALRYQLQRLQAMRDAGEKLMTLPQLGQEFYPRGDPQAIEVVKNNRYEATLYDFLKAYARNRVRVEAHHLQIQPLELYSVDEAIHRLSSLMGKMPGWRSLSSFLPADLQSDLMSRSAVATTFAASLELAKAGKVDIRQDSTFGPIYFRDTEAGKNRARDEDGGEDGDGEGR